MQQEDDIRGLAKTMEFMRAVSILFLVIHVYWYCYQAFIIRKSKCSRVSKRKVHFTKRSV